MLHGVLQEAAEAGDLVDGDVDAGQLDAVLEAAVGEVAADPVDGDVEGGEAGQADTTKLLSLSPHCLLYQVSPFPGGVSSLT